MGDEEGQEARDAQPDVAGGEHAEEDGKYFGRGPRFCGTDVLHPLTQKNVTERGKQDNEKDEQIGFGMQGSHALASFLLSPLVKI